jgi:hypothetical protein
MQPGLQSQSTTRHSVDKSCDNHNVSRFFHNFLSQKL